MPGEKPVVGGIYRDIFTQLSYRRVDEIRKPGKYAGLATAIVRWTFISRSAAGFRTEEQDHGWWYFNPHCYDHVATVKLPRK